MIMLFRFLAVVVGFRLWFLVVLVLVCGWFWIVGNCVMVCVIVCCCFGDVGWCA